MAEPPVALPTHATPTTLHTSAVPLLGTSLPAIMTTSAASSTFSKTPASPLAPMPVNSNNATNAELLVSLQPPLPSTVGNTVSRSSSTSPLQSSSSSRALSKDQLHLLVAANAQGWDHFAE